MDSECNVMWVMTALAAGMTPSGIMSLSIRSWMSLEICNDVSHVESIGDYLDNPLMWH